jgi:hypothetical protein
MIDVSFANPGTLSTAGLEHLVVVAPASRAAKGPLPRGLLDKKRTELVRELAARTKPGRRGALGSTLAGGPTWLHLAVLPDAVSRYNAPSRADSVRFALAGLPWGAKGKALVVLLLDDPAHSAGRGQRGVAGDPGLHRQGRPGQGQGRDRGLRPRRPAGGGRRADQADGAVRPRGRDPGRHAAVGAAPDGAGGGGPGGARRRRRGDRVRRRRAGGARPGRHLRRRQGRGRAAAAPDRAGRPGRRRRATSPWSARASPSTPAGCT